MPHPYSWSTNPLKLQRALAQASREQGTDGADISEDRVKELYISFGGKTVELKDTNDTHIMTSENEEEVVVPEETDVSDDAAAEAAQADIAEEEATAPSDEAI